MSVTDGTLNIELITAKANAKINAIVVTATQVIPQYTITATAGYAGKITPQGELKVNEGVLPTFVITPNQDYRINDFKVDGISHGAINTYTFPQVPRFRSRIPNPTMKLT